MIQSYEKSPAILRLGVVGCGKVFERLYLPALKRCNKWKLVAICEPIKDRLQWAQKTLKSVTTFESFATFLEKSSLDAVLISTPPKTHCLMAVKALKVNLHVLVEKPMALNIKEALLMHETSKQTGKQLWVGFNRKFRKPYRILKDKLSNLPRESIKDIFFQLILNPYKWQSLTSFMGDDSKGGGILDDVASHQVDLLSWLLDDRIKMVKAKCIVKKHLRAELVLINLKFENDLIANCLAGHGDNYDEKLIIQLNNETIIAYPTGVLKTHWRPGKLTDRYLRLKAFFHYFLCKVTKFSNITIDSIENQLHSFAKAIRGDMESLTNDCAETGVRSVEVIQACRKSLQSGGKCYQVGEEDKSIL